MRYLGFFNFDIKGVSLGKFEDRWIWLYVMIVVNTIISWSMSSTWVANVEIWRKAFWYNDRSTGLKTPLNPSYTTTRKYQITECRMFASQVYRSMYVSTHFGMSVACTCSPYYYYCILCSTIGRNRLPSLANTVSHEISQNDLLEITNPGISPSSQHIAWLIFRWKPPTILMQITGPQNTFQRVSILPTIC